MSEVFQHLIFFDGKCAFCHQSIRYILSIDKQRIFCFAPLDGNTADAILSGNNSYLQKVNSLVLVENFQIPNRKFWIRSKAVFRMYWLIGGKWKILGFFYVFPAFLGDLIYRFVAKHRHKLGIGKNHNLFEGVEKGRFLP